MIDREQVAEALEAFVIELPEMPGQSLVNDEAWSVLRDAARAWLDQGDALVIRKDAYGNWPAAYDDDGYTICCSYHRSSRKRHRSHCVGMKLFDALSDRSDTP